MTNPSMTTTADPSAAYEEPSCFVISRGAVLSATPKAAELFGYGSADIIGVPLTTLLPHFSDQSESPETLARHRDGSGLWLNIEMIKIPSMRDGLMLLLEDVTDSKLDDIATMPIHRYLEKTLSSSSRT